MTSLFCVFLVTRSSGTLRPPQLHPWGKEHTPTHAPASESVAAQLLFLSPFDLCFLKSLSFSVGDVPKGEKSSGKRLSLASESGTAP